MPDLREKLKNIPKSPGVYQFKNKDGAVLYVGKAKNLRSRVSQYFTGHDDRPQLPFLLAEAADVTYTVVSNELEAAFLENTLIKQYMPKYNIDLRDDKNYAFITIDYSSEIPKIGYARRFEPGNKQIKYFGPYSAAYKIRNTLNLVRRIFPYCANTEVGSRPCFYYYLHRCPGVCIGKISLDEYKLQLDRICWFLSGNTSKIHTEIKNEMKLAAGAKEFEKAARLRDQLRALETLEERQNVILTKPVDWDIISLATNSGYACVNLFKIREGKMIDRENFVFEVTDPNLRINPNEPNADNSDNSDEIRGLGSLMQTFLEQYYLETSDAPKTIYTQFASEDAELIGHIIRSRFGKKAEIISPQKSKPKELVSLGIINAEEHLKKWLSDKAGNLDKINNALAQLKEVLHLEKTPERIECYDISNIQGTNAAGSMVVFEKGLPKKSEYRKFRIKTKQTPDDFAMMKEMLTRRFARSVQRTAGSVQSLHPERSTLSANNWPLPDLIVIDGGKGQLSAAIEVLSPTPLALSPIPIIGLAKRIEEIFLPNNPTPIILSHDDPGLQLLQRLRDEAHRFGITYHRTLRSKQAVKSALDDIPGIGPKTKKLLKEKFGTIKNIKSAKFDELVAVVGKRIARLIAKSL